MLYNEPINPDTARHMLSVLNDVLRDCRFRRDLEDELYRCFDADIVDIFAHLQRQYGSSLGTDQLYREIRNYVNIRAREIENAGRSGYDYQRAGVERSSMSYNRGGGIGGDIGRMMNDTISRTSGYAQHHDVVQRPVEIRRQPQPQPAVKQEAIVETWKFGKTLSDLSNVIVAIEALDTTWSTHSIDHKNIELSRCVNSAMDAIVRVKPFIINTSRPFLMSIGCCRMVYCEIPSQTLIDLHSAFQQNEIYAKIDPGDSIFTERHAKAVLSTLDEFMKRVTHTTAIQLEKFFVAQLRNMIRAHLVDPKDLDNELLPTELSDMEEFFRGGKVYDRLKDYPKFGPLRDLIIRTAIPYSIQSKNICCWTDSIDRMSILSNVDVEQMFIGDRHISEIILSDDPEFINAVNEKIGTFTILKIPMQIIYSNIFPNDMRYKMSNDDFDAWSFPVDKASNIIEAIVADKIHGIERYVHLQMETRGTRSGTYGGIVDGTIRIAPIKIE